ncbi:MAG TPA: uracil-DNA glycosylase family protein [Alloacidobacterium sp.]|nr:uracil-DNA glycosylase family protein [Alloacidobacterium sp.]
MNAPRKSEEVIQQLLVAMDAIVTKYHPTVRQTGLTLSGLIPGTAFFPGGSGLWRGLENNGPLPTQFPDNPIMFVGHNFDSVRAFDKAFQNGGEVKSEFWKRLLAMLRAAEVSPESCFFTNALMGLKPGSATGSMPSVRGYREQCALFLQKQVDIVRPVAIVALGVKAEAFVSSLNQPWIKSLHPTDWHFRKKITRQQRLQNQGELIADFLNIRTEFKQAQSTSCSGDADTAR